MRQGTRDGDGPDAGLSSRCARRVRERAFLVDAERLCGRVLLRAGGSIDEALEELLAADERAERAGLPLGDPWTSPYAFLIHGFGVEPRRARAAAVRFNGLSERARRAFFALLLDAGDDGSAAAPQDDLHEALRALFPLEDP